MRLFSHQDAGPTSLIIGSSIIFFSMFCRFQSGQCQCRGVYDERTQESNFGGLGGHQCRHGWGVFEFSCR